MLGREGRPVQRIMDQGRQRGAGPGEKGWSLSTHLKGSRLEQAHEIRPNFHDYNYDYCYNKMTAEQPFCENVAEGI